MVKSKQGRTINFSEFNNVIDCQCFHQLAVQHNYQMFPYCVDALINVRAALVSTKSTAVLQSHSLNDLCGGLYATIRTKMEASLTNLKVSFTRLLSGKDGKGGLLALTIFYSLRSLSDQPLASP